MLVPELRDIAENLGLKSYKRLSKQDLIYKILDEQALTVNAKNMDSLKSDSGKEAKKVTEPKVQEENKPSGKKKMKQRNPRKLHKGGNNNQENHRKSLRRNLQKR